MWVWKIVTCQTKNICFIYYTNYLEAFYEPDPVLPRKQVLGYFQGIFSKSCCK